MKEASLKLRMIVALGGDNSGGRTRTCDPTVNSRLLYQLSYAGNGPY